MTHTAKPQYDVEDAVRQRYQAGARNVELALCCPTEDYDGRYLEILPQEIIEKDYGCGDPSKHVGPGETVVDLGSGAGKICYILSQKVGEQGRVIGVDVNDEMLALARKYQKPLAEKIGYQNTRFVKGRIQDLALDLDAAQAWLDQHPVRTIDDAAAYEAACDKLRAEQPMIADDSVDAVVSNCVLNLVRADQKMKLFAEIFRVLKRGGRAVISDIVCDEDPTETIMNDPEMWSGCIAGAFREDVFLQMFEDAGFFGIEVLARSEEPWRTIDGVEFRSMTVRAYKGKQGPCMEAKQAVVYKGPWKQVRDDDNHVYHRGQRMAVCDKTFRLLTHPNGPYAGDMIGIEPRQAVADPQPYDCKRTALRHPRETKGADYDATAEGEACCTDGDCG